MNYSIVARRWISAFATVLLSFTGLVTFSTAAHATTSVDAVSYQFTRNSADGHSLAIPAHSDVEVTSGIVVGQTWSGWPVAKGTVFARTALTVNTLPTHLILPYGPTPVRGWTITDAVENKECFVGANTKTYTTTAVDKCAKVLVAEDTLSLNNRTGGALTIDTNANAQSLTRTIKKTVTTLNGLTGVTSSFSELVNVSTAPALSGSTDRNLDAEFRVCLDESKFVAGDHLVVSPTVARDGTPLVNDTDVEYTDYDDLDGDGSVYTYTAPTVTPFENLEVNFGAFVPTVSTGTYSGSVTVTKDGVDVTEPCPTGAPAYPTVSRHHGPQDDRWFFTSEAYSMPTNTVDATGTDDWDHYGHTADGFGGVFYWTYVPTNPDQSLAGAATVVHETATGPDNSLRGGIGTIPAHSDPDGQVNVGRYGANGANWYDLSLNSDATTWTLVTGSMTTSATTTTSYSMASLLALCGKGFTSASFAVEPTSTVNPAGEMYCTSSKSSATVLVSLTPTKVVVLAKLPAATTKAPCVDLTPMVENRAVNAEAALQYYVTASAKGTDGVCGGVKGSVASRTVYAIAANGTVTSLSIAKSPWGTSSEPDSVTFGSRLTRGDWLGLASSYDQSTDTTTYGRIFTINAKTGITLERVINYNDLTNFGMWTNVRLVDEYADNRMRVVVSGTVETDGEWTARYAVGHIDFRPGDYGYLDLNDFGEATGFGYYSGKMGAGFSTSNDGTVNLFLRTSDSQYTVGSWGPPV